MGLRDKIRKGIKKITGEEDVTADEIKQISKNPRSANDEELLKLSEHLLKEARHLESLREYIVAYGEKIDRDIAEVRKAENFRQAVEDDDTRISNAMERDIERVAEEENAEERYLVIYRKASNIVETKVDDLEDISSDQRVKDNLEEADSILQDIEQEPVDSASRRRFLKRVAGGVLASAGVYGAGKVAQDAMKNLEEDEKEVKEAERKAQNRSGTNDTGNEYRLEADGLKKEHQKAVSKATKSVQIIVSNYNKQELYDEGGRHVGKVGIEEIALSQKTTGTVNVGNERIERTYYSYSILLSGEESLKALSGEKERKATELLIFRILSVMSTYLQRFINNGMERQDQRLGEINIEIKGVDGGLALVSLSRESTPSIEEFNSVSAREERDLIDAAFVWRPVE